MDKLRVFVCDQSNWNILFYLEFCKKVSKVENSKKKPSHISIYGVCLDSYQTAEIYLPAIKKNAERQAQAYFYTWISLLTVLKGKPLGVSQCYLCCGAGDAPPLEKAAFAGCRCEPEPAHLSGPCDSGKGQSEGHIDVVGGTAARCADLAERCLLLKSWGLCKATPLLKLMGGYTNCLVKVAWFLVGNIVGCICGVSWAYCKALFCRV